jgi:energy-coupling factor transport system substrate-specific component
MSWEAAILVLLAVALLGGFAWYERSRPPAQIVALVAVLAALAAAGRVALSPIPNVVPTTDLTLIAGFSLGGPAGFAVGALAALVSNFWLGQGPWTPWQMAGWGIAGLIGAGLAAATGRRLGRIGLAVACGITGLLFGALMDLSLMVSYGGEQSLDRFLAISARSVPFNAAHVAGNVALALVAGPALVRMLSRYRRRFEFAWPERGKRRLRARGAAAGAACLFGLAVVAMSASAPPSDATAGAAVISRGGKPPLQMQRLAVAWLRSAQNSDGGFGTELGGDSSPEMTGWAVLALEGAGSHPESIARDGDSALAYMRATASEVTTTGDIERTILALSAAGLNASRFKGGDLVKRLVARRGSDGSWAGQVNPTAFGVLALDAAGRRSGNARSASWLRSNANSDGGWGFSTGASSDPDSTGAVLQALRAAGGSSAAIRGGVRYLRASQRTGGGFAISGGPVNAQSTAWAVQGLLAAGVSPSRVRRGGRSPLDYLASVQARDGHYRYSGSSDQTPVWVTSQALLAASRRAFPLPGVSTSASGGGGGGGAAAAVTSPSVGAAGGAAASRAGTAAAGSPAASVGGAEPAAAPANPEAGAVAAAPQAARFETSDEGSDTLLLAAIAAGIILIAICAVAMQRRTPDL